jgi:hypothetical protein
MRVKIPGFGFSSGSIAHNTQDGRLIFPRSCLHSSCNLDRLARDLKAAFPDMRGFSPRNLKCMRALAQAWPRSDFVQQPAAQLLWFYLCTLLDKMKTPEARDWYADRALVHGWSRQVLVMQTRLMCAAAPAAP